MRRIDLTDCRLQRFAIHAAIVAFSVAVAVSAIAAPHQKRKHQHLVSVPDANGNPARVIGSRPKGCPHAYCGCGLARFLGLTDKRLNLAWNWAKLFPRTHAHPGAAAVKHHHVMQLIEHVGGSRWLVRDYNGGRHLSWIHVRSVRGYVFVDPSASAAASPSSSFQ